MLSFVEQLEQRRFLAAGDLDLSFGGTGLIEKEYGPGDLDVFDAGVQPGDRLVVSGNFRDTSGIDHPLLLRYSANGVLESGFAGTTVVGSKPRGIDRFNRMEILPDGRILLEGTDDENPFDPVLMRLTVSGKVDSTFGTNGVAPLPNLANPDGIVITRMLIQPDGKILIVAGKSGETIYVARYEADGAVDTGFGEEGLFVSDLGLPGESNELVQYSRGVSDLAVAADGTIVLVGTYGLHHQFSSSIDDFSHPIVFRLTASGELDTSFAGDGVVELFEGQTILMAAGSGGQVVLDPGGVITFLSWFSNQRIHRILPDGQIDTGFGVDGIVDLPSVTPFFASLVRQADGKLLIAAGDLEAPESRLIRTEPDGSMDASFGTGGVIEGNGGRVFLGADGSIFQVFHREEPTGSSSHPTAYTLLLSRRWAEEGPAGLLGAGDLLQDPQGSYRFQIEWRDDDGIDVASLNLSHLRIVGPDGTSYTVRFAGTNAPGNGTARKAYYKFGGPGGTWDPADNGRYRVKLLGGILEDTNGDTSQTRNLGFFNVSIPSAAAPALAPAPTAAVTADLQSIADDLLGAGDA